MVYGDETDLNVSQMDDFSSYSSAPQMGYGQIMAIGGP